jgi:hypothetical protein
VKWIGEHISLVEDKSKTTIVIHPHAAGWIKSLMGAWVAMWMAIGATVVWSFFALTLSDKEKIILAVFLTFWIYYAVRVTRTLFWLLWGKELIKMDEIGFHYKRSIRGYGASRPYYYENISKIQLQQPEERSIQAIWEASPWIRGSERIGFEYRGQAVKFGIKLNEKDSKLLFRFVSGKIEEKIRKSKY